MEVSVGVKRSIGTKGASVKFLEQERALVVESARERKGLKMESCGTLPQSRISILVIDSMAITSELLGQAFSQVPGFEISGCPKDLEELEAVLFEKAPDIALIKSSDKNKCTLLKILETIHNLSTSTRSIVLFASATKQDIVAYFHGQARGILPADLTDFETLCRCIRAVHEGKIWASAEHLTYLVESLSWSQAMQIIDGEGEIVLSKREQEVFLLLAEGRSNRAMAEALNLSEHTVKNHLLHIFDKLGVSSRTEAVLYGMRRGIVTEQKNPIRLRSRRGGPKITASRLRVEIPIAERDTQ